MVSPRLAALAVTVLAAACGARDALLDLGSSPGGAPATGGSGHGGEASGAGGDGSGGEAPLVCESTTLSAPSSIELPGSAAGDVKLAALRGDPTRAAVVVSYDPFAIPTIQFAYVDAWEPAWPTTLGTPSPAP